MSRTQDVIRRHWLSLAVAASTLGLVGAAAVAVPVVAQAGPDNCLAASPAGCYTPRQFRTAYDVQPLLDRGIDGRGVTVSFPEHFPGPTASPPQVTDIRQDLATFDRLFDLPPAHFTFVTGLAGAAAPWEAVNEEVIDTEIVHAVAPEATLRVVLIPADDQGSPAAATANMVAAMRLLTRDTDVVSYSGSQGEHFFSQAQVAELQGMLREASARQVTVVASSGDSGVLSDRYRFGTLPVKEVSLPASDPFVLSVGGTRLTADPQTGAYIGETAWNQTPAQGGLAFASGGGFSGIFARPAYQDGVPGAEATRGVPDVAADAGTGMALSVDAGGGTYDLDSAGGTSAAAPLWAGLIALADQLAGHDLGTVNPALYRIAGSPLSGHAFHDVTTGDNTVTVGGVTYTGYQASPGWDPVTGLGSPNAAVLVPLVAAG